METTSPPVASAAGNLLHGYRPPTGVFDEMFDAAGAVRAPWQSFHDALGKLGRLEFTQRWQDAREQLRLNGVTYNLHGDSRGLDRTWQLDPVPLIIAEAEAKKLEAGLIQRAQLLEAILQDLYGKQLLLQECLIPPELIFANSAFLRPCHGITFTKNRYLALVAFDFARDPAGNFVVISHRSQAPSGAGYALENRIVMARMLPEFFRDCNVQRIAMFFRTFRENLRSWAPHNRDNPRIVLMTPGPRNETYFEHAYLARYLGYTLVEGGDLTVRDQRVYLKLLDGLQPVDVILRRLDDVYCDPLELKPDSFLGVPGLVQAVRSGNVVVANALGCGLAESPGLIPYLPALCRRLLGSDLYLPSAQTFWCGDPLQLDHVISHLERMVVKSAFPGQRHEPTFGFKLSRSERLKLAEQIQSNPIAYVGQEQLQLSTSPVMTEAGVQPRHLLVRSYLTPSEGSFTVMPGGLTRYSATPDTTIVSVVKGGGSKDTWIQTSGPVSTFTMLRSTTGEVELSRGGGDLPSRAADNLFWLGRYVERTEGIVRLLRGIFVRLIEKSDLSEAPELPLLMRALTSLTRINPAHIGEMPEAILANPQVELLPLVYDRERVGSLAFNLRAVYRTAASVRDRISLDMWRVISSLEMPQLPDPTKAPSNGHVEQITFSDTLDVLSNLIMNLAAFGGLAAESMTRGHGWRFLDMGRKLERSFATIQLLKETLVPAIPVEAPLLEALLEIADSLMTFRRRYLSHVETAAVLDLLLADDSNPRSLVFQLEMLRENVLRLPQNGVRAGRSMEQRVALSLVTAVQLVDIEQLAQVSTQGTRLNLEELLDGLDAELPQLAEAISHHFLSHLQISRHLAGNK